MAGRGRRAPLRYYGLPDESKRYDVFISHAGEDKHPLAIPIYNILKRRGFRAFLDRPELRVGENAVQDMIDAMETASVGLFLLSPEFAFKKWPMLELNCFLRRAAEPDDHTGDGDTTPEYHTKGFGWWGGTKEFSSNEDTDENSSIHDDPNGSIVESSSEDSYVGDRATNSSFKASESGSENSRLADYLVDGSIDSLPAFAESPIDRTNIVDVKLPVLVPVFYRLTVAECKNREEFEKRSVEPHVASRFDDRVEKGDTSLDDVMRSLSSLSLRTGIENCDCLTNDSSEEMKDMREKFADTICDEVTRIIANILRKEHAIDRSFAFPKEDPFTPSFNAPRNVREVVLHFESTGKDTDPPTVETKLLREVLHREEGRDTCKVITVMGQAGVGKSCLLRELGRCHEVKRVFVHGAYYISLGMDADETTLISELLHVIRASGGKTLARSLRHKNDLKATLQWFGKWMSGKIALLLIDDLWDRKKLGASTVTRLSGALCFDQEITLVIATRFSSIAAMGRLVVMRHKNPLSAEAEAILLRYAQVTPAEVKTEELQAVLHDMLLMCGGLPVCLAVMGRGVAELTSKCAGHKARAWVNYLDLARKTKNLLSKTVDQYDAVISTLSTAVTVLKERWGEYALPGSQLSWWEVTRSLCVAKKHSVLAWGTLGRTLNIDNEDEVRRIGDAFASVGLGVMEMGGHFGVEGLRLHDLVHDFVCLKAESAGVTSVWHSRLLNSYCSEEHSDCGLRPWWDVENDGYVRENICRHLRACGGEKELVQLLLNVRWTNMRYGHGGLLAWNSDFEECLEELDSSKCWNESDKSSLQSGLCFVRDAVVESWATLKENRSELGYQMFGRLCDLEDWPVQKFLDTVAAWHPRPWLRPLRMYWMPPGSEVLRGDFQLKDGVTDVVFLADPLRAVACAGKRILIMDLEKMEVAKELEAHGVITKVAVSDDKSKIMSLSLNGTVQHWDVNNDKKKVRFVRFEDQNKLDEQDSFLEHATLSPNGSFIVAISPGHGLEVRDTQKGSLIRAPIQYSELEVCRLAVSQDCRRVAGGGMHGEVRIWNLSTAMIEQALHGQQCAVTCLSFSPCGAMVACGYADGTLHLWNLETGMHTLDPFFRRKEAVLSVAFTPDSNHIVSCGMDSNIFVWDPKTQENLSLSLRRSSYDQCCVAVSPDGRFIVSGELRSLRVWDLKTVLNDYEDEPFYFEHRHCGYEERFGHKGYVDCLSGSPNGRFFVSGSWDCTLRIWNATTGQQMGKELCGHKGLVSCLAVSPDSRHVVSGSADSSLRMWDINSHVQIGEALYAHTGRVLCVACSPNGRFIVSGAEDGLLRVWRADKKMELLGQRYVAARHQALQVVPTRLRPVVMSLLRMYEKSTGSARATDPEKINYTRALGDYRVGVCCVIVSPDGQKIVSALKSGRIDVWNFGEENILEHVAKLQDVHSDGLSLAEFSQNETVSSFDAKQLDDFWLRVEGHLVPGPGGNLEMREKSPRGVCKERPRPVVCMNRFVQVNHEKIRLATLMGNVVQYSSFAWDYNAASNVFGVGLVDGRVILMRMEE